MKNKLSVILLAAGKSSRFNSNILKPFVKIGGKPIIWYSLNTFEKLSFVDKIYIVVSSDFFSNNDKKFNKYIKNITKFKNLIIGGKERQDSVYNALQTIKNDGGTDFIAIHDTARPFIKSNLVIELYKNTLKYNSCACGIQPVDTIKVIENGNIIKHLKRKNLVAIQTPQLFEFHRIYKAYKKLLSENFISTDDTEIYSKLYGDIKLIDGDKDLIKITYKDDIKIAKEILARNKNQWI